MDVITLSRLQFGITTAFHFLFVPLTLGLVWFVAIFQTQYYRIGEERYRRMAKFWGKLFLINFGMGIVTGIVQEFQFGMNWSEYSRFVGDVFGSLLAIEALVAFFLESVFLGIWIFGENQVSKRVHLLSIWMAAIGSLFSSIWILLANGWMQHPVGHIINPATGRAELVDFLALVTNFKGWLLFWHAISAGFATAAIFVLGVSAWHIVRRRELEIFRPSFALAALVGVLAGANLIFSGHTQGQEMREFQPMKLAAIEAIWETEQPASFSLLTIGDLTGKQEIWSIRIPYLMSFLACNNFDCEVRGVNDLQAEFEALHGPGDYIPLMVATYWSFRIMVAFGFIVMAISLAAMLVTLRNWPEKWNKWLKYLPYAIPLPFVAGVAGWVTTEMGRQPWVVYGLLRAEQAISPNLTPIDVAISLVGFTALYSALTWVMIYLMRRFATQSTEAALTKSVDVIPGLPHMVGAQD
jgi:cytochrome d ubiquinol oxidase subunit I